VRGQHVVAEWCVDGSGWQLCLGFFTARDTLREWQDRNHPWLELTDIHRETTENMRVTVMPFYIGSRVSTSALSLSAQFAFDGRCTACRSSLIDVNLDLT